MKKLNLAIIGQGRSGKRIHGGYYLSERNQYYNVKYVVDADEIRRGIAKEQYPDCTVFADYQELFGLDDVDLVVNATYSELHYAITKDLLLHGFILAPSSVTTLVTEERVPGEVWFRCAAMGDTSHLYVAGEPISHYGRYRERYGVDEPGVEG